MNSNNANNDNNDNNIDNNNNNDDDNNNDNDDNNDDNGNNIDNNEHIKLKKAKQSKHNHTYYVKNKDILKRKRLEKLASQSATQEASTQKKPPQEETKQRVKLIQQKEVEDQTEEEKALFAKVEKQKERKREWGRKRYQQKKAEKQKTPTEVAAQALVSLATASASASASASTSRATRAVARAATIPEIAAVATVALPAPIVAPPSVLAPVAPRTVVAEVGLPAVVAVANVKNFVLHSGSCRCAQRIKFSNDRSSFLITEDERISKFGYFIKKEGDDLLACERKIYNDYFLNNESLKIRCAQCILGSSEEKNPRVLFTSNDVTGLKVIIAKAKKEKEGSQKISADAADALVYVQKKLFTPCLLHQRRSIESLKLQLRESGYDVDKGFNVEARNSFVWRVVENSNEKCDDYILMMANVKESDFTLTVTLDIPGGKRRLGESTLKAAVRETYEETFVSIRKEDLELIYGTETDKIYSVV